MEELKEMIICIIVFTIFNFGLLFSILIIMYANFKILFDSKNKLSLICSKLDTIHIDIEGLDNNNFYELENVIKSIKNKKIK